MMAWRLCVLLLVLVSLTEVFSLRPRFRPFPSQQRTPKPSNDDPQPPYEIFWYTQTLDHFNFNSQPQTYQQRYLISKTYFNPSYNNNTCSPMIFYTGNEGDITWFYNNTGFATMTLAKEFNALVVFAEHRYYGESMPFGANSFTGSNVGYLTSEQALADYAQLIPILKSQYGIWGCPVIAVGGSYGGMLSSWFRIKYPNVADAAIAASAPILQFYGTGVTEEIYNEIITDDFALANQNCPNAFKEGFAAISNTDLPTLTKIFQICDELNSTDDLLNWFIGGIGYMAMADYPYNASFLEPMPAWPVNLACDKALGNGDILSRMMAAISVYYNSTGEVQCFNTSIFMESGGVDDLAWDYQACTEMVFPISANGKDDMFPPSPFNLQEYIEGCQQSWGVTPRPNWITTYYGGQNITAASNIVFSNGQLDPWRGGGVTKTLSPTLVAIIIEEGAHHLDLRGPNPADPQSVIDARATEIELLHKWLNI